MAQDFRLLYSRWNIQIEEARLFTLFKNRVLFAVELFWDTLSWSAMQDIERDFLFTVGHPVPWHDWVLLLNIPPRDWETYKYFEAIASLPELAIGLEVFFSVLRESDVQAEQIKGFAATLRNAIALTPGIEIEIVGDGEDYHIIPAGAKILDRKLVDEVLQWLEGYPLAKVPFEEALRIYLSKDQGKYRNLLDNLRLALEELVRTLLGNKKSLENQKVELLRWMRVRKASQPIISIFSQLVFGGFRTYQNEFVKHESKFNPQEVEFLIYLVGAFMRLLIILQESAEPSAERRGLSAKN